MYWTLFTVLAILSRATYGIATKLLSSTVKLSAASQGVLLTFGASLLTIIISPLIGGLSFTHIIQYWWLVLAMILAQAIGNVLFFKGQPKLEASVTQIAFSSILLWSVLLSIVFLGSHFSLKQALGIAVLFVAILLIQYRKGIRKIDSATWYIVASALLFAFFQVASAELAHHLSAATYLLLAYGGATVVIAALYPRTVLHDFQALRISRKAALTATTFASSTSLLYFLFAYFAYQQAPDRGIVVVLLTSQVVVSVILAIVFLKERQNMGKKLAAGVLAVLAGVLIKS